MRPVYFLFVLGVSMLISCTKAVQPESPVSCNREDEYQCLLDELGVKNLSLSPEEFYLMSPEQKTELRKALGLKSLTKSDWEQGRWNSGYTDNGLIEEIICSDTFIEDSWSVMYLRYYHLLSTIGDTMFFGWKVKWQRTYSTITGSRPFSQFAIESICISSEMFDKATITKYVEGDYAGDVVDFVSEVNVFYIDTAQKVTLTDAFRYDLYFYDLNQFPSYFWLDAYESGL